ncbi:hypothetical protein E3N88_30031 [Mikania micrantha]|uniref:Retrotransposon Copia-like N-terminal domain-containing protein n=1 Tax=Mikania micrantha TaxID=192012 RepID=A0A5N6ML22_9ASTR|nr:hypothetical protein E3N88_30031 [Mikania micrantha]
MADHTTIVNPIPNTPTTITMVTFPSSLKLTSTNYLSWKTQIEAILQGLDLFKFINGTHPSPPPTVKPDGSTTPHADYNQWYRQDRLLFGALVGTLSAPIVSLINHAPSSLEAWNILANTHAATTRGHIKQLQHRLKNSSKSPNQTITEYMHGIKQLVDELAILGKTLDAEDISDIILHGLDSKAYKPIIDSILARDTPIHFHELHEKLINHELSLAQNPPDKTNLHQPITAFTAQSRPHHKSWNPRQPNNNQPPLLPTPTTNPTSSSKPYLEYALTKNNFNECFSSAIVVWMFHFDKRLFHFYANAFDEIGTKGQPEIIARIPFAKTLDLHRQLNRAERDGKEMSEGERPLHNPKLQSWIVIFFESLELEGVCKGGGLLEKERLTGALHGASNGWPPTQILTVSGDPFIRFSDSTHTHLSSFSLKKSTDLRVEEREINSCRWRLIGSLRIAAIATRNSFSQPLAFSLLSFSRRHMEHGYFRVDSVLLVCYNGVSYCHEPFLAFPEPTIKVIRLTIPTLSCHIEIQDNPLEELWRTFLLTPFKLITVFLHEASHAIACKLTCGEVMGMEVHANEGGVTQTRGGIYWLILPAGYLGSSFWGMLLILASTDLLTARIAAGCLAAALLIVLFIAKNVIVIFFTGFIIFIAIVWILQEKTTVRILRYVILFIGIFFFHNSVPSFANIYDDLISRRVNSSDAEKFAEICPCPCNGVAWGVIWSGNDIFHFPQCFRISWTRNLVMRFLDFGLHSCSCHDVI